MVASVKIWLLSLPCEARNLVMAVVLIVSMMLLTLLSFSFTAAYQSWAEINRSAPRIARLKGYELARENIDEASTAALVALQDLAFNVVSDQAQEGAKLQQVLRAFAEDAGLTISGSQLLQSRDSDSVPQGFSLIRVRLDVTGMPEALIEFLGEVYGHSPMLDVIKLNIGKEKEPRNRRQEASVEELQTLRFSVHVSALLVTQ